jgi:preprotein translocase subunit YajC
MAGFLPLILIFGLMYVLMIRPQQKKAKQQQALVASISAGDEVLLNSGIYGTVNEVDADDPNVLWIEVYQGVELKVRRGAVDQRLNEPTAAVEEPAEDADED